MKLLFDTHTFCNGACAALTHPTIRDIIEIIKQDYQQFPDNQSHHNLWDNVYFKDPIYPRYIDLRKQK